MQEQEAYEAKGMDAEAKKAAAQAGGYYNEWLSRAAEPANLVKNTKDDLITALAATRISCPSSCHVRKNSR